MSVQMQAYFISVVWSCYKFLCQTHLGHSGRSPRVTDFEMDLVNFDRAVMSSSSTQSARAANNMPLGTELMVTHFSTSLAPVISGHTLSSLCKMSYCGEGIVVIGVCVCLSVCLATQPILHAAVPH